jgi:hypothetical protein
VSNLVPAVDVDTVASPSTLDIRDVTLFSLPGHFHVSGCDVVDDTIGGNIALAAWERRKRPLSGAEAAAAL